MFTIDRKKCMTNQEFIKVKYNKKYKFSIRLNITDRLSIGELEVIFISLLILSLLIIIV
jgi:hypothetical protein